MWQGDPEKLSVLPKAIEVRWDQDPASQDSDLYSTLVVLYAWGHRNPFSIKACVQCPSSGCSACIMGGSPSLLLSCFLLFSLPRHFWGAQFEKHLSIAQLFLCVGFIILSSCFEQTQNLWLFFLKWKAWGPPFVLWFFWPYPTVQGRHWRWSLFVFLVLIGYAITEDVSRTLEVTETHYY